MKTSKLAIAEKILGYSGMLISFSKSGYQEQNPDNLVVFNSNICTIDCKIWFGDIDITLSLEKLQALATELGETIYVLYEMDARFENEDRPKLGKYVIQVDPDNWKIADNLKEYYAHFPGKK